MVHRKNNTGNKVRLIVDKDQEDKTVEVVRTGDMILTTRLFLERNNYHV